MTIQFDPKKLPQVASTFSDDIPLVHYAGGWYEFGGQTYTEVTKEYVSKRIVDRFAREKVRYLDTTSKKYRKRCYNPSIHWARGIREYLAGESLLSHPRWLVEHDFPAEEILPVQNGLLHIPTRELIPHTRDFFSLSVSDATYYEGHEPLRQAPAFASMLHRIWETEDQASIPLFQDLLGYLLTQDPPGQELQKFFLLRGAARGGKGTAVKIIEALVGPGACAQIAPENIIRSTFALMPLIDHRIGLLGDLRIADDREIGHKLLPLLLKIVGGDPVSIDRKYKAPYHARLNTRLIIESNMDLGVHDATGALASRIVPLIFPRSFAGQEDPSVPAEVLSEIDSILLWALEGWDRVYLRRKQGKSLFDLPKISVLELEEIKKQGSIIIEFLAEYCEQGGYNEISLNALYAAWKKFAVENNSFPHDSNWLRQEVRAAWPRVTTSSAKPFGGQRVTMLQGLCLQKGAGK